MRAMAAFAMLADPPAVFPDRGWSGVLVPVVVDEVGGTRFALDSRKSDGSIGSNAIVPSFCRSRNLMSRRLMWRST